MGARTGPSSGPVRAFSAFFACMGPADGPVRALDSRLQGAFRIAVRFFGVSFESMREE